MGILDSLEIRTKDARRTIKDLLDTEDQRKKKVQEKAHKQQVREEFQEMMKEYGLEPNPSNILEGNKNSMNDLIVGRDNEKEDPTLIERVEGMAKQRIKWARQMIRGDSSILDGDEYD